MPKVDKISDLLDCDATYVPEVISGVVQSITGVYSGIMKKHPFKPFKVQRMFLDDGTGKIQVSVFDREPFDESIVGQTVHFMSTIGRDGSRVGLRLEDNVWDDDRGEQHSERRAKVYPSGNMSIGTYGLDDAENPIPGRAPGSGVPHRQTPPRQAAPPARAPMTPRQQTPAVRPPVAAAGPAKKGFGDVRIASGRLSVMMIQAYRAALYVSKVIGEEDQYPMPDAAVQAAASSIFISLERAGMAALCPVTLPDAPKPQHSHAPSAASEQMANADADPSVDGPVDEMSDDDIPL